MPDFFILDSGMGVISIHGLARNWPPCVVMASVRGRWFGCVCVMSTFKPFNVFADGILCCLIAVILSVFTL